MDEGVRDIRPIAETLTDQSEIIDLYEKEIVRIRNKANERNRKKREKLRARIDELEAGEELKKLQAQLDASEKKLYDMTSSVYELQAECVRLRRQVEAQEQDKDELKSQLVEAAKKVDKAERMVRNMELWAELSAGRKQHPKKGASK